MLIIGITAAAQSDSAFTSPKRKIQAQVGSVNFSMPVYLDSIKTQKNLVVINGFSPDREILPGYKITSYEVSLISKTGAKKISIVGNSFLIIRGLLTDAEPGTLIMLTNIKCQKPDGSTFTLENLAATLK
jgi:hypothetical protein